MTYYEWVKQFKLLETSPMDENIIKNLENKTIDKNAYVINKLLNHTITTIQTRLHSSGLKCLKQTVESNLEINVLSMNLMNLKKEKQYVLKITELPIFDSNIKTQLIEFIDKKYEEIKETLQKTIENIDIDGQHINIFEQIMSSK